MADDKSSESLSQITREDCSELANFLTKVEEKNKENSFMDFDDYTPYHLTKEDVELLERHGAKQGHFIEGNNLTKIDYNHINNRLEKEVKELGLREASKVETPVKTTIESKQPTRSMSTPTTKSKITQVENHNKLKTSEVVSPIGGNKAVLPGEGTTGEAAPTAQVTQEVAPPPARTKPPAQKRAVLSRTSSEEKIDSWDKVHDLETFVKFIKDCFSGRSENEIIVGYNEFYENKEKKNEFIESNGGADNLANIIKQSQENKKQNLSPRQKAENLIESKMINFLSEDGIVSIEEARKIVGGHRGDYGYPLKSYVKNLEIIYDKKKKILEEGGTRLSLEAIGNAMDEGIETNFIGLKRRFITNKTKEAATSVKDLMMGEIVKKTRETHGNVKFDNLTLEQQTAILSNLKDFSLGDLNPTTSVLANSSRAASLIKQGLSNVNGLVERAIRNEEASSKCKDEIKKQLESAGSAIKSKSAEYAKKHFKEELNKLNGPKKYSEENIEKRRELHERVSKFRTNEEKHKQSTRMLSGFLERNKETIRRRNVTSEQIRNSKAVSALNFSNIMSRIDNKQEGISAQLKKNKKNNAIGL